MCGRYALDSPMSRLREQFGAIINKLPHDFGPRYNAAPMQMLPVVRQRPTSDERVVDLLRWGLIPSWAKDQTVATKLINARAETLSERPSFHRAFRARRCIVPASGFYEWKTLPSGKQPFYIYPASDELFGFAGLWLWERWTSPDGESLDTFTVVTTDANDSIRALYNRMPVILQRENYGSWLAQPTDPDALRQLLTPCPDAMIQMHPVSKAVGSVKNDSETLIAVAPIRVSEA